VGGDGSSPSRLSRFNSEENYSRVPLNEGWIGLKVGLGASGNGKTLLSCQMSKYILFDRSGNSLVATEAELSQE